MDTDVASSVVVPRCVDLALFFCGTALHNLRGELPPTDPATVQLHRWYLHKVCFLHALPNDDDAGAPPDAAEGEEEAPDSPRKEQMPFFVPPRPSAPNASGAGSREVNFTSAFNRLHHSLAAAASSCEESHATTEKTAAAASANISGRVHARSSSEPSDASSALANDNGWDAQRRHGAGFRILEEFINVAYEKGGSALARCVAEALVYIVTEHNELPGTPAAAAERAAIAAASPSSLSPVRVATLAKLFQEDLFDDELSMEAGNATRSFHIWVNYEWASASFLRQTRLATVATRWLRELCRYRDRTQQTAACADWCSQQDSTLDTAALSRLPTNLKAMHAALEGVFEGHANTHKLLMEVALMQRAPHLADNAVAKLLFLQGPSIAARMSRGELANRGTQPILTSITSGMLLYAQYYLSFGSLAVARQCVRVALQVAQEVHSNSILALAHYTAHVVAVHQGRPTDAANSISIALQLSLESVAADGSATGGFSPGLDGSAAAAGAVNPDGQMASVAFAGAAELLLFFPGAVSAALRSLLSTGRLGGAAFSEEDGVGGTALSGAQGSVEDAGRNHSGGVAVSVQTVAQSIRHAVLRAEAALLHTPPVEGRWVDVVAALHRETLLLIGALYGVVSTPTVVDATSLRSLLEQVRKEAALTSPLFVTQGSRSLFWEVLRHAGHHALSLQEHLLVTETPTRLTGSAHALQCLRTALDAVRLHYGGASVEAATHNVFFSCVVRYCAACRLQDGGYVSAAHALFTAVTKRLGHAAGAEGRNADPGSTLHSTLSDVDASSGATPQCWPPDNLLLYALAQRRRAETAAFLGLVSIPGEARQALLAVSSRYAFSFGVLTAHLMEAQAHQHNGRCNAALAAARRAERSALRIGFPSLVEAACALQVTAHSSSGDWRAAQLVLLRLQPHHGGHRVFVLLYKFAVHLELLLAEKCVSAHDVEALIRSWLGLMRREGLLAPSSTAIAEDAGLSLPERVCVLSTLARAHRLFGSNAAELHSETVACLRELQQRQGLPVPDLYVHGDCEEVCQHSISS
ncbi:hypothetical protein ABB37_01986 [Leptomonas pyrrhocoris]|uniref:Anaphase-promoting complex subunit 5 n=1 Tax=Leptomonas pyrrhocoris TaxID=157538 RepID=A0A0N0DY53_LEPPY|nr:hypothetical protein ABB37_01986 [Leptomonas pyrrhocoris]KPA83748.1 hypothetical protein ABB37_01986 [Leptomonas pyrrhocoris]|eukprot:XP_015662187.1 hypothetical protein ABB37_01986 [Leptomonas pyrrhocoris]